MKLNGYSIVNEAILINELSTATVFARGSKKIAKNVIKDPVALFFLNPLLVVPGSNTIGSVLHLVRNKGSRQVARLMSRKLGISTNKVFAKINFVKKIAKARQIRLLPAAATA